MKQNSKILIVEDSPLDHSLLTKILSKNNFTVQGLKNGKNIFSKIFKIKPDLIILDINLPGKNGIEICKDLKNNEKTKEIPVIFVSASNDIDRKIQAFKAGGLDYITKPFYSKEIIIRINAHLFKIEEMNKRIDSEKKLKESEQKYRKLFEISPDGILIVDIKTKKIKYANSKACKMFGYPYDELIKLNVKDIHPKKDLKYVIKEFNKKSEGDKLISKDISCLRSNGKIFYADFNSASTLIDGVLCNIGVIRDTTKDKELKEALISETLYNENIISTAQVIILILDPNGKIVYYNPYMEKVCGYKLNEVKGKDWFSTFLPKCDYKKIRSLFKKAINNIRTKGNINPLIIKDGTKRFIEWYDTTLRNSNGEAIGLLATGQDITQKLLIQEELKNSEKKFRAVLENSEAVIFIINKKGIFELSEGRQLKLLGLKPGEVVGKSVFEVYKDFPSIIKSIKFALKGKPSHTIVNVYGIYFSVSYSPMFDDNNKVTKITGIATNITERVKHEEEIKQKDKYLKKTINTVNTAIGISSIKDGRFIEVNDTFLKLSGYKRNEVIGKTSVELKFMEPDQRAKFIDLLKKGKAITNEPLNYLTKKGKIINTLTSASIVDCDKILFSCIDISEKIKAEIRKQKLLVLETKAKIEKKNALKIKKAYNDLNDAYSKLKTAKSQLIQTSKLATLGEMSTGLAHEINQPLTSIALVEKKCRKLMERDMLTNDEIKDCLDDVRESVIRIDKIIKHVRTFARQEVFSFSDVNVNNVVNSCLHFCKQQLKIQNFDLITNLKDSLPLIEAEPFQIEQVLLNCISNAKDTLNEKSNLLGESFKKQIKIETELVNQGNKRFVQISIKDNGLGMNEKQKENIFNPFYTTKEVGKGTGLGMSISYGIIDQHKGKITVKTKKDKWTKINILLPVKTPSKIKK